jgi:glycosyltransferase involved in cell wall biosynthesis
MTRCAYNWRRKKRIFASSKIYVSTPCRWLLEELQQSILAPGIVESRLIPYGIDLSRFHPIDHRAARSELNIPEGTRVLLFTANGVRRNPFKDYRTVRDAIVRVSERLQDQDVLFIAPGDNAPAEEIGRAQVRFVPYEADTAVVAKYFQAADLYVHAARADTFPNAILEALCCGTPVVATAVGGISEQIKGLREAFTDVKWNAFDIGEATGILVQAGDSPAMAVAVERLLIDENFRWTMAQNAANDARQRFDLKREAMEYLNWYEKLVSENAVRPTV